MATLFACDAFQPLQQQLDSVVVDTAEMDFFFLFFFRSLSVIGVKCRKKVERLDLLFYTAHREISASVHLRLIVV